MSIIQRLKAGLAKSRDGFARRLNSLFREGEVNESFYEEIEETLISGDVGVETTLKLLEELRQEVRQEKIRERAQVKELLQQKIIRLLDLPREEREPDQPPLVILLIGVNGSGKTTTAAKLAHLYRSRGKKVLLVAGDTFRAAAIEQLQIWADRVGAEIIKQQPGSDPSAVFFDALNAARSRKVDVVIGDTAGRLHTKTNLMDELNKIYRVVGRCHPGAPHQVLLVIDATTGQNGIAQASSFNQAVPITGLVLTKLDGTARGGIVVGVQSALQVPVCYIGIGEKMEDLNPFDPHAFVSALLD
ncbi:MAG TPA: signal recognition particle-docking protein FtsY [Bacillota bacterium]|jgi:fused signal recognition particle receptor|nr:signal recognition particle-docking protein FtsY [Bacillota bacterium]HOB86485.1 signal recognition particle-docking protein FtsY [Bacillota bacterium]HOP68776.1 signal recognition particle-docking protein FtsY [Bacillota bacterium]HPT33857.1 signal recognition particle-docking protein FtsY [Bacillota bacterium]HPZ65330.1 signal recognition particle-docking protein FtsY [Bacillota bacterium]